MLNWKFKSKNQIPPRGFIFRDPDTGHVTQAFSYNLWQDRIAVHRAGNGLPPIDPLEAEDQNCSLLGPACERYCDTVDPNEKPVDGVTLHWRDIVRGTLTLAAFKLAGSPMVSEVEANRRADICATCKFNVDFAKPCGGLCDELLEVVNSVVGGARTRQGDNLRACGVCSCSLAAKVWIDLPSLRKYETEEIRSQYPKEWCWMVSDESAATPPESATTGAP